MEEVIKILMRRDNLSYNDAKEEVEIFVNDAYEALENGDDVYDLIMDELGLEPDYIELLLS